MEQKQDGIHQWKIKGIYKKYLIFYLILLSIFSCKGQNQNLSIGDVYSDNLFLKKYERNGNDYLISKKLASFFNTKTDTFIDKGGALLNSSFIGFQELFLQDTEISYLIITSDNIITDTLKVPQDLDYSYNLQTNLKERYQSVMSLGIFHPKEEYYQITKLLGVDNNGKLIKLSLNTTIYDCPIPNKYITDDDSGNFTFGIKGKGRYKRFWNENNNKPEISGKWYGLYNLENKESEDWREDKSITLSISKDSIIYERTGYQTYEKYLLTGKESNNKLLLSYLKYLDGNESAVLEKTKDFGNIYFDSEKYLWESPYLDFYYDDKKYILNKVKK